MSGIELVHNDVCVKSKYLPGETLKGVVIYSYNGILKVRMDNNDIQIFRKVISEENLYHGINLSSHLTAVVLPKPSKGTTNAK